MKIQSINYNTLAQLEEIKNNANVLSYILNHKPTSTEQISIKVVTEALDNYKNICLKVIGDAAIQQELKESHIPLTELADKAGISVIMLFNIANNFYKGTYASLTKRGYRHSGEFLFPKDYLVYLVEYVWNTAPNLAPQLHTACLGLTPEMLFDRLPELPYEPNTDKLLSLNDIGNIVQIDRYIETYKLQSNWLIQLYRITKYYALDGKDYLPVPSMDTPILDEARSKALFCKFPELLNSVQEYWSAGVEVKKTPLDDLVAQATSLAEQLEATLAKIKAMA